MLADRGRRRSGAETERVLAGLLVGRAAIVFGGEWRGHQSAQSFIENEFEAADVAAVDHAKSRQVAAGTMFNLRLAGWTTPRHGRTGNNVTEADGSDQEHSRARRLGRIVRRTGEYSTGADSRRTETTHGALRFIGSVGQPADVSAVAMGGLRV